MRQDIITYLPWLLSVITIWMTVLAGNKHKSAWILGLANQALWLGWIVASASWGLLPMNIALWIVYARNHWKWNADNNALSPDEWAERNAFIERNQLASWMDRRPGAARPFDFEHVEIWREGWAGMKTISPAEMHDNMNVYGLYWRPHGRVANQEAN